MFPTASTVRELPGLKARVQKRGGWRCPLAVLALIGAFQSVALPAWSQAITTPTSPKTPSTISLAFAVPERATMFRTNVIPVGTPVILLLAQRLKSGEAKCGETVTFEVAERVLIGQAIIIPVGTPAYGQVENSRGASSFGHAGTLRLRCDYILLPGGVQVPVRTQTPLDRSGRSGRGAAQTAEVLTGLTAGGVAYFASDLSRNLFSSSPDHTTPTLIGITAGVAVGTLIGSLFRGGEVTLNRGQRLEVTVTQETPLSADTALKPKPQLSL